MIIDRSEIDKYKDGLETFHCVVCGEAISDERIARKAVTCREEHAIVLKSARRKKRTVTRCRMCNRPSTPEELELFKAWRRSLPAEQRTILKAKSVNRPKRERGRPRLTEEEKLQRAEKLRLAKAGKKEDAPSMSPAAD